MTKMAKEFKEFITRGNVIELACAVVLGAAFKAVIDAFIEFVVNPIIAAIFGKPNLDEVLTWEIRNGATISIGAVLTQVLSFILVALVLFFVIRAYNKLREEDEAESGPTEVELLTEIRDSLRNR